MCVEEVADLVEFVQLAYCLDLVHCLDLAIVLISFVINPGDFVLSFY